MTCKICGSSSKYWFECDGICWYCIADKHGWEIQCRMKGDLEWVSKKEV